MPLRRRTLFACGVCPHVGWLAAAALAANVTSTPVTSAAGPVEQSSPSAARAERYLEGHAGLHVLVELGLPASVWIPAALQPAVRRLLLESRTFREQCARLARHRPLHIGVTQDDAALLGQKRRAMAEIRRYDSGLIVVAITLSSAPEPYEALAHEFEHVLEYLERGSLRVLALSGARQAEVWASRGAVGRGGPSTRVNAPRARSNRRRC